MFRGFFFWHSQSLDRVTPPWLQNLHPPAMSPLANGTRHLSHLFTSGKIKGGRGDEGKRMIQRLNEESGHQENAVLSTWRWCKQCWLRLSQTSDRWPHPHSSLLTVLNKFNIIKWYKWSHEPWYSANVWCSMQYFFKVLIYRHTFVFTFSAYVFGNGTLWCWWRAKALRTKETVFRKGLYSWLIY